MTVEEYRIAQLYTMDKKSREESVGGEGEAKSGVEILKNEPYDSDAPNAPPNAPPGQYTLKIYHVGRHLPQWVRAILPKNALIVQEEVWPVPCLS